MLYLSSRGIQLCLVWLQVRTNSERHIDGRFQLIGPSCAASSSFRAQIANYRLKHLAFLEKPALFSVF